MAACEKCWTDAGGMYDAYVRLLEQRKDTPCTPAEQCGEMHLIVNAGDATCRCGFRQAPETGSGKGERE